MRVSGCKKHVHIICIFTGIAAYSGDDKLFYLIAGGPASRAPGCEGSQGKRPVCNKYCILKGQKNLLILSAGFIIEPYKLLAVYKGDLVPVQQTVS